LNLLAAQLRDLHVDLVILLNQSKRVEKIKRRSNVE